VPTRVSLRFAELLIPLAIAIVLLLAWQADRRDRAQLATQLAAAQQIIAQASANQKDRDSQLTQTLAQLTAQKNSNLSTAQLLQLLPQALHLPAPVALPSGPAATISDVGARFSAPHDDAHASTGHPGTVTPTRESEPPKGNSPLPDNPLPNSATNSAGSDVALPSADLKPLYDFALDCQACQAKLTVSQADLADEKTKSASLTKERDAALRAAKGGSLLRRIARAAKWFALGAAAGAVAAKATR